MDKTFNANVNSEDLKSIVKEGFQKAEETHAKYAKKFYMTNSAVDSVKADKAEGVLKSIKFINALNEGDRAVLKQLSNERAKALNEGTGSAGGYLAPEEFERFVIMAMDDYSEIRKYSTVLTMGSDVKRLNSLTGKVTVHKAAELTEVTASTPTFGEPVLTAEKYMGATVMSEELLEDSETEVISLLARMFGEKLAQAEQDSFIDSSVSGSEGLLTVSGTTGTTIITGATFSSLTFDDLAKLQKLIFAYSKSESQRMQFIMGMTAYNALRTSKASTSGNYFYMPPVPAIDAPATAWGRPIIVISEMPETTATGTKFAIGTSLADHFFIGDRRGITMKVQDQGTVDSVNLNTSDARALVVTKRTAQVVALASGVATLATN